METKLNKQDQLKAKNTEAKRLSEERKTLRDEINSGKEERAEARKAQAEARKGSRSAKSELAKLTAKVSDTFKSGDSEAIVAIADAIMEASSKLSGSIREFGNAVETIEGL
tara:strand:+ start:147 stop:479 length:333 start_codon:yes stop_codon:yes gene_type:complete